MALRFLSRWRPRHLVSAWVTYWVILAVATLGGAAAAAWKVSHLPAGQGSINLSMTDGVMTLVMTASGVPVWQGTTSLTAVALWAAGPPLLLWLAWLAAARRPNITPASGRQSSASTATREPDAPLLQPPRPIEDALFGPERERREKTVARDARDFPRATGDGREG